MQQAQCGGRWVIGRGHTSLKKFCGVMNLPPPVAKPAFLGHQNALANAAATVCQKSMQDSAAKVRAANKEKGMDEHVTAVSFDGTLIKRGFSSLHSVFSCIDWSMGLVLDV